MRKAGQNTKFLMDCIAQGLLELMREKSYEAISISEICKKAGVGRTTFYRHFSENGSKDDILIYYTASLWTGYCEMRREQVEKDIWVTLMNFIYDNRDYFTGLKKATLDHILFSIFYKTMGPAKDDNEETSYVKSFFAGTVAGITFNWVETGFKKSPTELARTIGRKVC